MTENPPPPPDDPTPAPRRDFDPRRPMFKPAQSPSNEPAGCASVIARVLLGIVSFTLAMAAFITIVAATADKPLLGLVIAGVLVAGLFVIRKRSGPSPILGAVVIGVSVAFVMFGGCLLILSNSKIDFR